MATNWIKVSKGIRYREHATRKHGIKKDRYYTIYYSYQGKDYNESIGWSSEGIKQENCEKILMTLRANHKSGLGAKSYKEMRENNLEQIEQVKAKKAHEDSLHLLSVFEDYLSAQTSKTPKSIIAEQQLFNNHILPFFQDLPISNITSRKLDEFLKHLQSKVSTRTGRKLSSATVRYTVAVIRQVWNYAIIRDIVSIPFPLRAKQPRDDNRRTRFLTHEEAGTLLVALKSRSIYIHDIALISLNCGLRLGEIFNLKWGDVNFLNDMLYIRDRKNKESGIAYMTPLVKEMLEIRYSSNAHKASNFVFANGDGTAKQFMSKTFTLVVKELGFNQDVEDSRGKVVFHTLRHTFASWLAQKGVSMFDLAELMGHKDITMTQRYSHHNPDKLRKSAMLITARDEEKATVIKFDKAK